MIDKTTKRFGVYKPTLTVSDMDALQMCIEMVKDNWEELSLQWGELLTIVNVERKLKEAPYVD